MPRRWWIYQRERFPLFAHGILIAAFSFSAVSFSALLRGHTALPSLAAALTAFVTSFLFFLQLRIADEFKDFEEDARYRPYRPVPRGLVSLRELGILGIGCVLVQLGLAMWLQPSLVLLLVPAWLYLAAMTKEFFVGDWLKKHALMYMLSHMMIMPLVDLYATACDWWPNFEAAEWHAPPGGLLWFLAVSYSNGIVIETGRKIRAPCDEETGVDTYSHVWGLKAAVSAWFGAMLLTAVFATIAALFIDFLMPIIVVLALLLLGAAATGLRFLRAPDSRGAKRIENLSGLWTVLMYLMLGAVPLAWRHSHG
jgi:4-hydroxybenzoate polyprenyltransferase